MTGNFGLGILFHHGAAEREYACARQSHSGRIDVALDDVARLADVA